MKILIALIIVTISMVLLAITTYISYKENKYSIVNTFLLIIMFIIAFIANNFILN